MVKKTLYVATLAIIGLLGGQTLSFADEGATAGTAPGFDGSEGGEIGHSEPQGDPESLETAGQVSEASEDDENASEGQETQSRPADGDPVG